MAATSDLNPIVDDRMAWWREARYGMFIHWGLYSLIGRGEWVLNRESHPPAAYEQLAGRFNPAYFDASAWMRLAQEAGMRYAVLTTKHHDGFCLFDSKLTDYTSVRHAAKRDFVAEFVEAARAANIRVGFYYSLLDWHHPDGDGRGLADEAARGRFVDYIHGQVRELLTDYGQIDVLWYDVPWPYDADGWHSQAMDRMARELQPNIIINNRNKLAGDFGTPEGHTTPEPDRDWEACLTLNDNWGYYHTDHQWKSPHEVLRLLISCARFGGNLLLNVGPDGDGQIPGESQRILREVGRWLLDNGAAIYGSERSKVGFLHSGAITCRGNTMFALIDKWPGTTWSFARFKSRARSARLLASGHPLELHQEDHLIRISGLPENPPDHLFTVIAIEFEDVPLQGSGPSILWPTRAWEQPLGGGLIG